MSVENMGKVVGRVFVPLKTIHEHVLGLIALSRKYAGELKMCGWSAANTVELERALAAFDRARSNQGERRSGSKVATRAAREMLTEVVLFRRRLTAALRLAESCGSLTFDQWAFSRGRFGVDPGLALSWLATIEGMVVAVDAKLRPYFGESAAATLLSIRERLFKLVAEKELARRARRIARAEVLSCVKEIETSISRLVFVATIAFAREPAKLADFRKTPRKRPASFGWMVEVA